MKRLKIKWPNKPKTKIVLDDTEVMVAQNKRDIAYHRYVSFKQLAPQFWEQMDSPLLATYIERFENLHNEGKYAQSYAVLLDYKLAVEQSQENKYDAWGLCFALICYEKDEPIEKELNDVELREKLERLTRHGLTADIIYEAVINFMKASPETFQDHLILLEAQSLMIATA